MVAPISANSQRDCFPCPTRLLENKFGFDLVYDMLISRPVSAFAAIGSRFWEARVIGGSMDLFGPFGRWLSGRLSLAQSGLVRSYAVMFAFGIGALAVWFVGKGV